MSVSFMDSFRRSPGALSELRMPEQMLFTGREQFVNRGVSNDPTPGWRAFDVLRCSWLAE